MDVKNVVSKNKIVKNAISFYLKQKALLTKYRKYLNQI